MHARDSRFWLRFESGEAEGERLPLPPEGGVVGRKPENDVCIADPSVSSRHARITITDDGVELVDLGSTNGTRVDGQKVERAALRHGMLVQLGHVRVLFEDGEIGGAPPDITLTSAEEEEVTLELEEDDLAASFPDGALAGEEETASLEDVGADALRKSTTGGRRGLVLGILLFVSLGVLAWRLGLFTGSGGTEALEDFDTVAGNLVADPSFEDPDTATWASAESATVGFRTERQHARRGGAGLGAELADGEWALAYSPAFDLPARRSVELRAWIESTGDAYGRVGIELATQDESGPTVIAWSPALVPGSETDFTERVLAFDIPPGYDRGRVAVGGLGTGTGGRVSVDDVSIVVSDRSIGTTATFEEYSLFVLGSPGSTAALVRSGRVLFASIGLADWGPRGLRGAATASLTASAYEGGLELSANVLEESAAGTCTIRPFGDRALVSDEPGSEDALVSTIGAGGYRSHAIPFARELENGGATDLLVGAGVNLIRFGVEAPGTIRADRTDRAGGAGQAVLRMGTGPLTAGDPARIRLQLSFRAERDQAFELAADARSAERDGSLGEAHRIWSDLLDRFPFEADLTQEAEETRARIEAAGHDELESIRQDLERARFFELSDLFRACRSRARAAEERFAGSGPAESARELAGEIGAELGQLATGGRFGRVQALEGVRGALDSSAFLRERVDDALEELRRDSPPEAPADSPTGDNETGGAE